MKILSSAFADGQAMDSKYTCDGLDISPPFTISDVPVEAKSLVLIMDDTDAIKPAGKVWDHWIVFNIPPDTTEIPEGQEPAGVHGLGTSDNLEYHGPCPPDGEHAYIFKFYALDTMLGLQADATKPEIERTMKGHIIAQTKLVGKYNRNL
ncbi:YbhB/YbcL family Raf kinase inhibitor-like protein [bacterium]|nr:YbhB/YbcL family Raf kinase inhibitor-like protein [bacterium]